MLGRQMEAQRDGVPKYDFIKIGLENRQNMLVTAQSGARWESAITTSTLSLLHRVHLFSETETAACRKNPSLTRLSCCNCSLTSLTAI